MHEYVCTITSKMSSVAVRNTELGDSIITTLHSQNLTSNQLYFVAKEGS